MIKLKFVSLLILAFMINSCDLDQVENHYMNYNEAVKDKFLIKGWIPESLIFKSMKDIYVRNNLDLNTCIFSFQVSKSDFNSIKIDLNPTDKKVAIPRLLKIPKWWFKNVSSLTDRYFIIDNKDSVFISVDSQHNKIFGWRR